mgnify:CR=1 FL=1
MTKGVAVDLLEMANRVGRQNEATEYKNLAGEEGFSLDNVIMGAIEPFVDGIVELSMKAPMSVSKPADLG